MAKLPQPFHFDLFVDGAAWQAAKRAASCEAMSPVTSSRRDNRCGARRSLERPVATLVRYMGGAPRKHLVTYHGVLAPAAGLRSQVVPKREEEREGADGCSHAASGDDVGGAAGAAPAANLDRRGLPGRLACRQHRATSGRAPRGP